MRSLTRLPYRHLGLQRMQIRRYAVVRKKWLFRGASMARPADPASLPTTATSNRLLRLRYVARGTHRDSSASLHLECDTESK
jgi:hypothetical protein